MDEPNTRKINWKRIFYIILVPFIAFIVFIVVKYGALNKFICESITNEVICGSLPFCYYNSTWYVGTQSEIKYCGYERFSPIPDYLIPQDRINFFKSLEDKLGPLQ